jgi:hypothetical protein
MCMSSLITCENKYTHICIHMYRRVVNVRCYLFGTVIQIYFEVNVRIHSFNV